MRNETKAKVAAASAALNSWNAHNAMPWGLYDLFLIDDDPLYARSTYTLSYTHRLVVCACVCSSLNGALVLYKTSSRALISRMA